VQGTSNYRIYKQPNIIDGSDYAKLKAQWLNTYQGHTTPPVAQKVNKNRIESVNNSSIHHHLTKLLCNRHQLLPKCKTNDEINMQHSPIGVALRHNPKLDRK